MQVTVRIVHTTFPPEVVCTYTCNIFIRCVFLAVVANDPYDLGLCWEGVADSKSNTNIRDVLYLHFFKYIYKKCCERLSGEMTS